MAGNSQIVTEMSRAAKMRYGRKTEVHVNFVKPFMIYVPGKMPSQWLVWSWHK
jgi:uncharacterized RmlC-like cupin family protein